MANRYDEALKATTERISKILVNSSTLQFKFMGYKNLKSRLMLYYDDCTRIYDFEIDDEVADNEPFKIVETNFYTDKHSMDEFYEKLTIFQNEYEKDKPQT